MESKTPSSWPNLRIVQRNNNDMDVMKPQLVRIEGRCYRFFESDTAWSSKDRGSYVEDSYPQEFDELNEESSALDIKTERIANGQYKHSFYVAPRLFGFLIGANGATIKKLQADTKTTIKLPPKKLDADVAILGATSASIVSARHRINLLLESSKKKIGVTHFASVPLTEQEILLNFEKFKNDVLANVAKDSRGVEENLFQNPLKLHITVAVFVLVDNQEIETVIKALKECKDAVIDPITKNNRAISVKVKGVDCMNDDPSRVDVLFACVHEETNVFQELLNKISKYFWDKGLSKDTSDNIKIHVTLMNSKYIVTRGSDPKNWKQRHTFDASKIIEVYKDFYFGESKVTKIDLCAIQATEEHKYYDVLASINLLE